MLKLCDITKNYAVGDQQVPALKGISLSFRKNEFVSILGPSGCGKTTLMNIIGGLDRATSGELKIDGKETKSFKDKDWDNYRNKKIGFIFQNYYLIPHLSILANVELSLTIAGISKTERIRRAKDVLSKVGLTDQQNKRPNQLSGGQMQRVAIARALVNEPDIILADEPTGALDTKTSIQILNIIKKISKTKLVIMVTHNSMLAEKYSTRVIKMLDGKITSDSNSYNIENAVIQNKKLRKSTDTKGLKTKNNFFKNIFKRNKNKTSMSFFAALNISFKNLLTKKGRAILISIAGSIGIIGIALILALSNGINVYIAKAQADTLSSNPIRIMSTTFDLEQIMNAVQEETSSIKFPENKTIFIEEIKALNVLQKQNNITQEYIDYIETNLNSDWYYDISYKTGLDLNVYGINSGTTTYSKMQNTTSSTNLLGGQGVWQQLASKDFFDVQFDIIDGHMTTGKNEAILIIDQYNKVNRNTLIMLGLINLLDTETEINFSEVLGKTYKVAINNQIYVKTGDTFENNSSKINQLNFNEMIDLEIVGIARMNRETDMGVMGSGIAYTKELTDWLLEQNSQSEIVEFMNENPTINPFTGQFYTASFDSNGNLKYSKEELRENDFRRFGGTNLPNEISIYPKDFASKNKIKEVLNNYNIDKEYEDLIVFTDLSAVVGNMITNMVNVITYVLIGLTAVSLLVSSVMISIITYASVIERTKEIGILRSVGARKKDISRVFNAENVILGFCSGTFGILISYLLCIPISLIIERFTAIAGLAKLNILNSLLLILISMFLMLVAGFIPSKIAAKKDPVKALRTE